MLLRRSLIAGSLGAAVLVAFGPVSRLASLNESGSDEAGFPSAGVPEELIGDESELAIGELTDSQAVSQQIILKSRPSSGVVSVRINKPISNSGAETTSEEFAIGQLAPTGTASSEELSQPSPR